MPQIISQCTRRARKPHTCDYCYGTIQPGEEYDHAVLKEDDIYTWDAHTKCHSIASDLWNFIDPWDWMTADDFQEGCSEFCRVFICPDCEKWDKEAREIGPDCDNSFCTDKIYEFLKTHELRKIRDKHGYMRVWKCFPKEKEE